MLWHQDHSEKGLIGDMCSLVVGLGIASSAKAACQMSGNWEFFFFPQFIIGITISDCRLVLDHSPNVFC